MDLRSERILLVSYYMPGRNHGGGLRLLDLYSIIRKLHTKARLDLVAARVAPSEVPDKEVVAIFDSIQLVDAGNFSVNGFASAGVFSKDYDVVDLQYLQSGRFIQAFRDKNVRKIIFSPMESMVRSLGTVFRDFKLTRAWIAGVWRHLNYALQELRFTFVADHVLCVSNGDARVLRCFRWWGGVSAIETGVSPLEFPEAMGDKVPARRLLDERRVVFVAFFGSTTNTDALKWYLEEVHALVLAAVPGYRFRVVGRGIEPGSIQEDAVDVVGEVARIEPCLEGAWVGIAPALSGAGLRGKINQYAIASLPCVASTLAAEGLAYRDDESISLAGDAAAFAKRCIRLLSYPQENLEMGLAARKVCLSHYVWEAKTDQISRLYVRSVA
jgi:glycosyltransferase involved in cell wall biosynthesis